MRLLPYDGFVLRSSDPPDVILGRLATLIAVGWFFFRRPPQPFRGRLDGRRFKVIHVLVSFSASRRRARSSPSSSGRSCRRRRGRSSA